MTANRTLRVPIEHAITEAEREALFLYRGCVLSRAKRQDSKGNPNDTNESRQRGTGHAQQDRKSGYLMPIML